MAGVGAVAGRGCDYIPNAFRFLTPICAVIHSHSFLKLCAVEWLQSSRSWEAAVVNKPSLPMVAPPPSLSPP